MVSSLPSNIKYGLYNGFQKPMQALDCNQEQEIL
jgi:hypothetical protein